VLRGRDQATPRRAGIAVAVTDTHLLHRVADAFEGSRGTVAAQEIWL